MQKIADPWRISYATLSEGLERQLAGSHPDRNGPSGDR